MEYLLVAVLLYFIARTAGNLVGLLRGGDAASRRGVNEPTSAARQKWEGPSPRQATGQEYDEPTFWDEDIEDATWYDIEDASTVR